MQPPPPIFKNSSRTEVLQFAAALPTRALGKHLEYHDLLDSTNARASVAARAGAPHGLVVLAEEQSAGRGRRGRIWVAPPRRGLLFSVLFRYEGWPPGRIGWLALAAGLAVTEAIEKLAKRPISLKWPNDIVIHQRNSWRKLGGILCEGAVSSTRNSSGHAIVGIGINVLQRAGELPEVPKAQPTSIFLETGKCISRKTLLAAILVRLESRLAELGGESRFPELREELQARLASWWKGRWLRARSTQEEIEGLFRGLDDFGRLRLERRGGSEIALADAEIVGVENPKP